MFTANFHNICFNKEPRQWGIDGRTYTGDYVTSSTAALGDPFALPYNKRYMQEAVINYGNGSHFTQDPSQNVDVIFGNGTAEEYFDDYKLDALLWENITYISSNIISSQTTYPDPGKVIYSKTCCNNNDSQITITEVGLLGSSKRIPLLVYRKKLKNPIKVPAHKEFTITIELEYTEKEI